jgi:hypothetical protein
VRNRIAWAFVLASASFLILAGCGSNDSNPAGNNNSGGTTGGDIAITVGSGTNPTYTWAGVGVFTVSVTRVSDQGTVVWQIVSSMGQDDITSPVTHGTVPATALATFTTETTLTAGVEYAVTVGRTTATSTTGFGYKTFTP